MSGRRSFKWIEEDKQLILSYTKLLNRAHSGIAYSMILLGRSELCWKYQTNPSSFAVSFEFLKVIESFLPHSSNKAFFGVGTMWVCILSWNTRTRNEEQGEEDVPLVPFLEEMLFLWTFLSKKFSLHSDSLWELKAQQTAMAFCCVGVDIWSNFQSRTRLHKIQREEKIPSH